MSVLAVVSKAVFEKQARVDGELLATGDTWSTSVYTSANPALEPLREGGDLYLVTVRPGDVLWLVGVLRAPKKKGAGWAAEPSTTPIRDISSLVPKLRFATGKGLAAAPGKLGMSLQSPRSLAESDVALLEGNTHDPAPAPKSPADAYASSLAATPAMRAAEEYATKAAAKEEGRGRKLRLVARRAPYKALTRDDRKLLAEVADEIEDREARPGVEVIDVADVETGERVYLLALWPFGSGVLVETATKTIVADVAQHGFEMQRRVPGLRDALAAAWHRDRRGLGVHEMISFEADEGVDPDGQDRQVASRGAAAASNDTTLEPSLGAHDVPVAFEGATRLASHLVSDAVHELRPVHTIVEALLRLGAGPLGALWVALAKLPPGGPLTGQNAKPPKGAQAGSPTSNGAHAERWVRFLAALGARIGAPAETAAEGILASRSDWAKTNRRKLNENRYLSVPFWLEQCVALALLARAARAAGGPLDESHDDRISTLALSADASYGLPPVLEELPLARAGKIACAQIELILRFPTADGAAAAIERFERQAGPYYEKKLTAALAAIGPEARPALEAAIERGSEQASSLRKILTKMGKGGAAKKGAKGSKATT